MGADAWTGLVAAVDAAFAERDAALAPWPRPAWFGGEIPDDAYSRLTDPARYLIVGARVDAWVEALCDREVARLTPAPSVVWADDDHRRFDTVDRLDAVAADTLPLIVIRWDLDGVPGAVVELGAGDPTVVVRGADCLCDACDSGSADLLEMLDEQISSVVTGAFRRLSRGDRTITQLAGGSWSARGEFRRRAGSTLSDRLRRLPEVDEVLADPAGWHEVTGASWI